MTTGTAPQLRHAAPLPDDAPRTMARAFADAKGTDVAGRFTLRHWRGDFRRFDGARYERIVREALRRELYDFSEQQAIENGKGVKNYVPNTRRVNDVLDSLAALCQVDADRIPTWVDDVSGRPSPENVIAFQNGLLDVSAFVRTGEARLMPPTPEWFSENAVAYRFDPAARCPEWEAFVASVLDGPEAVLLLAEWFGLQLTADTRYQKMLLMIGSPRAGKGVTLRALQRMVGTGTCVSVYLSALGDRFGLEPLVGKSVAICPDAHLGRGADAVAVLEKLKSIVGEDGQQVERKHRESLASVRLPLRFTLACNEFPRLPDASAAMRSRLLPIQFSQTFEGREDRGLDDRLAAEAPGILRWSMEGLRRLRRQGRFTEPGSTREMLNQFSRLSSPITGFVEDCCTLAPQAWCAVDQLWKRWGDWCGENGHQSGSKPVFCQHLQAAVPGISNYRPNDGGSRARAYRGIDLGGEET